MSWERYVYVAKLVYEIESPGKMRGNRFFRFAHESVYRITTAFTLSIFQKIHEPWEYVCLEMCVHLLVLIIAISICLFTEYYASI